jgi:cytochrome c oxidase subunit IV
MAEARSSAAAPGHIVPVWVYALVYLALMALTVATVGAAFVDLGPMNNLVALGIAALKGTLVVLYFMHVRWSSRLIPLALFLALFWLVTLIAGTMGDYVTRGLLGVPGK